MKDWFKGGLRGIVVYIVLSLITSILVSISSEIFEGFELLGLFFTSIIFSPLVFLKTFQNEGGMGLILFGPLINITLFFIIGAIIGKVKSKNRENEMKEISISPQDS
jgi:predicted permease